MSSGPSLSTSFLPRAVSVIIPALNEEANIQNTIYCVLNDSKTLKTEVIVVDGDSSDNTRSVAAAAGARVITAPRGRARQMNGGARSASPSSDLLLFVHADTLLPPRWDALIADAVSERRNAVGGATQRPRYGAPSVPPAPPLLRTSPWSSFKLSLSSCPFLRWVSSSNRDAGDATANGSPGFSGRGGGGKRSMPAANDGRRLGVQGEGGAIWGAFELKTDSKRWPMRVVEWGVNRRTRLFGLPYGDQAIFVERRAFDKLGGYREVPLLEDLHLVRALGADSAPLVVKAPVVTSARRWEELGVLRTTLLNQAVLAAWRMGVPEETLGKWYRKGKLMLGFKFWSGEGKK